MSEINQKSCRNLLLRQASDAAFAELSPHMKSVSLDRGDVLVEANTVIETVYFVESGICSLVLKASDDRSAEIGIIGIDGVVGASPVIGIMSVPYVSFMQVPGSALTVPADVFRTVCDEHPDLALAIERYRHVLSMQGIQTALANAQYTVEERLARWLLMCQDRIGGNEIELTHDFLGTMLSVRRSTVTLATHLLEGAGIIRAQRGRITVVQRKELAAIAAGSYGMPETEYERIIGPFRT